MLCLVAVFVFCVVFLTAASAMLILCLCALLSAPALLERIVALPSLFSKAIPGGRVVQPAPLPGTAEPQQGRSTCFRCAYVLTDAVWLCGSWASVHCHLEGKASLAAALPHASLSACSVCACTRAYTIALGRPCAAVVLCSTACCCIHSQPSKQIRS